MCLTDCPRLGILLFFGEHLRWINPLFPQLLNMDNLIRLDNLPLQFFDLRLVHCLDLGVLLQICSFEMLKFDLKFFELTCDSLEFIGKLFVLPLEVLLGLLRLLL